MTTSMRRYTSLPYLLDMLSNKHITLVDPRKWEDTNDSFYIEKYKEAFGHKSVLALCFVQGPETYYHWKVYSGNISGVCIEFNFVKLLEKINIDDLQTRQVEYKTIKEIENNPPRPDQLPFLKRHAFYSECEYRILYVDEMDEIDNINYRMTIDCISKIIINPWLQKSVFQSTKKVIQSIDGCSSLKITQSSVLNNEKWKRLGLIKMKS